ncbi:SpoIIE family protein phosphatase [Flexithrix dorotheae]|uniref:SpoIIE family protein phosphatase n=1 Tax=Flexithrix dorotheae TaxID=70993 RepID=UPI00037B80BA|nr:SpoIIE family protein phosphatase [Flexithrix dorotheae]
MNYYKIGILSLLSLIFSIVQVNAQSLPDLMENYSNAETTQEKSKIARLIAYNFQLDGALEKANDYFLQSFSTEGNHVNFQEDMKIYDLVGDNYVKLSQHEKALENFNKGLALAIKNNSKNQQNTFTQKIADLQLEDGNVGEAIKNYEKILNENQLSDNKLAIAKAHNNLGYLYKKENKLEEAKVQFTKALEINQEQVNQEENLPLSQQKGAFKINLASSYLFLGNTAEAIRSYQEALQIYKAQNDSVRQAEVYNYLGALHYLNGNNPQAQLEIEEAIEIGEAINSKETLVDSYKILSEIYNAEGDFLASQKAYKNHIKLNDELDAAAEEERKQFIAKQIEAEKNENLIKESISKKREQELALKQAELEAEKKAKELELQKQQLALVTREKELQETRLANQALEKKRVQQALQIANQQLEKQKSDQELISLQQEKVLQEAALREKELQEKERQKAFELLETEKKLQDQVLLEEQRTQKIFIGIIIGTGFVVLIILYGFVQRNKANKKLTHQAQEIKEKNEELQSSEEELRQNMEELEATQEAMKQRQLELEELNKKLSSSEVVLKKAISKLKESENKVKEQNQNLESAYSELEDKNSRLTDSIKYAERIQNAILPAETTLDDVFDSHFVIYKPKDMVSGDFYWFSKVENKSFIAAVDCTGHGVPGAFMSMIGNTLLNQIVNKKDIYSPEKILETLHYSVREALKQRDSNNVDGMDVGLCCLEDLGNGKIDLKFSGAKCPLFHRSNEGKITKLSPDRKSIGGWQKEADHTFNVHQLEVEKGEMIYLTTDGIIDAANNKRRRFGTKRLSSLIERYAKRPTYEQKLHFERELDEHQTGADQRDDITFLGIRL